MWELSIDMLATASLDGYLTRLNPSWEAVLGYTPEELTARPYIEFVHPDDVAGTLAQARALLTPGCSVVSFENRYRTKHGSHRRLAWNARTSPDASAVYCVVRDVTDAHAATQAGIGAMARLAEAEDRFRGAFERAPIAMGLVGLDGRWTRVNQALCDFTGYDRAALLARTHADISHPEDAAGDARDVARTLAGECQSFEREARYVRADGSTAWGQVCVSLVRDAAGAPVHLIRQIQDLTERRRSLSEIATVRDKAIEASRVKSEFLATMSHEIRAPLNGVIGMTELLLSTSLTPEQGSFARSAATSGEVLLGVINDVLDFSKIEAGRLELDVQDFDLRASVEDLGEMLAGGAFGKGVELTVQIADDVPELVAGDRNRLRQVLTNLVVNAIKFTDAGEVAVEVRAEPRQDGSAEIRFAVTDTGIGIAEEDIGGLFESFSQADSSTARRYGGTGLGLAIARRLIGLMEGSLGAVSRAGAGSRFEFAVTLATPAPSSARATPDCGFDAVLRILVVDDNATSRAVLDAYLGDAGLSCEHAASAAAALAAMNAASERPFDVVVADMGMPEFSGIDLVEAVREVPALSSTGIVLLSATPEERAAARAVGIGPLLAKPVRRAELLEAISRIATGQPGPDSAEPSPATQNPVAAKSARVLVVDDNAVNQLLIETMLTQRGFEVETAGNGLEALDRLAAAGAGFAAVFMDCEMPELDGYAATREIRTREAGGSRLPIIALTANALVGEEERCTDAGMDDYIVKPLRARGLDTVLDRWIGPPGEPLGVAAVAEPSVPFVAVTGAGGHGPTDITEVGRVLRALSERRLVMFAQPIVALASDTVVQHELLIRMIGEHGELIPPNDFLPIAERYGLVSEVDRWVLRQAAGYAADHHPVHLNISGGTLADPDIGASVERELVLAGAEPGLLTFEITETALVANQALAAAFIDRVRSLGCHVALDDFGSGYGGFSYLKRLPVDCLKIDREFVSDLLTAPASERIVRAIVQLAAGFELDTVAEGVEDQGTLEKLRALGVSHAQGYHFARPAPAAAVLSASRIHRRVLS